MPSIPVEWFWRVTKHYCQTKKNKRKYFLICTQHREVIAYINHIEKAILYRTGDVLSRPTLRILTPPNQRKVYFIRYTL